MKLFLLTCFAITAIAITSYAQNISPLTIGANIPMNEVKMKDVSGKDLSLKDISTRKGLLVMFSCNTCPYVIKNQERTKAIMIFAKKMGYGVVIINSNEDYRSGDDSYEAMKKYAQEQGYDWNYLVDVDSKLANAFGATRTPETFLFDGDGKLVYHGAIDDNPSDATDVKRNHLQEAIVEVSEGKEITIKESRSVGCSIKRKS